jgi:hypothetical protein
VIARRASPVVIARRASPVVIARCDRPRAKSAPEQPELHREAHVIRTVREADLLVHPLLVRIDRLWADI